MRAVVYLQTCVRNIVLYPTNLSLPRTRIKTFWVCAIDIKKDTI